MNRRICSVLIILTILSLVTSGRFFSMPVRAAATPALSISPPNRPLAAPGSTVTYDVNVSNISPDHALGGWEIFVRSNSSILNPIDFTIPSSLGQGFEGTHCVNNVGNGCNIDDGFPGTVHSVFALLGNPVTGNLTLLTITFKAVAGPYSLLTFLTPGVKTQLFDPAGNTIPFTAAIGSYGSVPVLPVAGFTWSPLHPFIGDNVTFDASSSNDLTGRRLVLYSWYFAPVNGLTASFGLLGVIVNARFQDVGNWTATLFVKNDEGVWSLPTTYFLFVSPHPALCKQGLSIVHVPVDCPTINSAIGSVVPGGTVLISRGIYNESLVFAKSLMLEGEGHESTVLIGSIGFIAAKVTIAGLVVDASNSPNFALSGFESVGSIVVNNTIIGPVAFVNSKFTVLANNTIIGPVSLDSSQGSVLTDNFVAGGLSINSSPGSVLRRNLFKNNFDVSGIGLGDFVQDIDISNTIDGKQIYYVIGVKSPHIPGDVGYIGLVLSSDVLIGPRSVESGVVMAGTRNVQINGVRTNGVIILNSTNIVVQNSTIEAGIAIITSSSVLVQNNSLSNQGISIAQSNNIQVLGNDIRWTSPFYPLAEGINLGSSKLSLFKDNFISGYGVGILLSNSPLNQFEANTIKNDASNRMIDTPKGIVLENSPQNIFRNNRIIGAFSSLEVLSQHPECFQFPNIPCQLVNDYRQDINPSNTIDGKPIYYLVGAKDTEIPPNAGYIAIINSTGVRVPSANLQFSGDGIHIVASTDVLVENANLTTTNNFDQPIGIWGWESTNVTIENSIFTSTSFFIGIGISMLDCSRAVITGNVILPGTWAGINLYNVTYSTISGNRVSIYSSYGIGVAGANNTINRNTVSSFVARFGSYPLGIWIRGGPDFIVENTIADNTVGLIAGVGNTIYHNNFVDNFDQAGGLANTWDNGAGQGNFWSDYRGVDNDGDGVGDTLLPHHGLDNLPLMSPWSAQGLAAQFTGRVAWPEHSRFVSSRDDDGLQTLFAKAVNTGSSPEWIDAIFTITYPDSNTATLTSEPVWVVPGGTATLTAAFKPPPGAYSVTVQLRFSSDAFLSWTNAGTSSFTFEAEA